MLHTWAEMHPVMIPSPGHTDPLRLTGTVLRHIDERSCTVVLPTETAP